MKYQRVGTQKRNKIFLCFSEDVPVSACAKIVGVNRNTINSYYNRIWELIFKESLKEIGREFGEFKCDESYFGSKRILGKRERGAAGKTLGFGLLKRGDKVYVLGVESCSRESLMLIIQGLTLSSISRNNFDILLRTLEKESHETPTTDYYTRVSRLPEKSVKEYAIKNIESFANNVMLCGSGVVSEIEESFIELLNLDSLPDDIKKELIERNSRKISDMTRMAHTNMQPHLLNENKIAPSWKNIMECFKNNENRLEESLIHFINDEANADELAKESPLTDEEIKNENGNYEIV